MLAQISVDDTPYPPRQLMEGQTPYDWDTDGMKQTFKDDLSDEVRTRLQALDQVAQDIVLVNKFAQDILEEAIRHSKLLGVTTSTASRTDVVIPLPEDFKDIINATRKPRATKTSILPPLVRKGYRVPRRDWAFPGAVHRPDRI